MDLFSSHINAKYVSIPVEGGELYLMHDFLTPEEADFYFRKFMETVEWRQEILKIYGKAHLLQRETAWYGDPETTYHYSGLTLNPLPWTPELFDLKKRVEKQTGDSFNTVLLNKYRSGSDKVGWHSDHEKEFGRKSVIASLSFGISRHFDIREKKNKENKLRIELHAGSLLVMKGEFQQNWEHQVPPQKRLTGVRINLTFRKMITDVQ